jgi:hypothetical protein
MLPLHAAAVRGHTAVLRVLLDHGAPVDAVSAAGALSLLLAAEHDHLAVVDLLLLAGADPNMADASGMLPLQVAVEREDITLLQRLLQANADCNASSVSGHSLLAVAAAYDSVAVVEALLAAGARSSSINEEFGHDALEAAVDLVNHSEPQVDMVVALLSRDHAAPSVAATRAALLSTMQTGLYDISARLLLHLHQAAHQEGISQDDAVPPVYDAQPVQHRSSDERACTSLALLHAWTADTADTAAARAELAGQEQEVVAVRQGARDLMVQTAASQAEAAAAAAAGEEAGEADVAGSESSGHSSSHGSSSAMGSGSGCQPQCSSGSASGSGSGVAPGVAPSRCSMCRVVVVRRHRGVVEN